MSAPTSKQIRGVVRVTLRSWPVDGPGSLDVNLRPALEAEFHRQGLHPTTDQVRAAVRLANSPLRRLRTAERLLRYLVHEVRATARSTPRWMEPPRAAVDLHQDDLDEDAVRFKRGDLPDDVVTRVWARFGPVISAEGDVVAIAVWTNPDDAERRGHLYLGNCAFAPVSEQLRERIRSVARKHSVSGPVQFDAELRFVHGAKDNYELTVWLDA